jgi:dihydrodipicolinate synthase/N-acetylneuraminate lyase
MARQLISKYRDRLVIYGGGSMLQYLPMALHGSPGYVGGFCNFMPQIELDFMKLMDEGHIKEAARLAELEFDLFDLLGSGNWFNFLVALINASGLPGGHCRPPLPDWPSGDVEKFKRFLCEMEFKYDEITHANNQQG